MTDREILIALLAEARATMRQAREELSKLDDTPEIGVCREAVRRVHELANMIDTKPDSIAGWTDRTCIIALVSEARNALVPARFWLSKLAKGEAAKHAVQQLLDFATEAVNDLKPP